MVILDKINKFYYSGSEKIHVIDNVSAVLPDKGLVFILGPSGSGKSTLLNLLGGLDNPDSGDIWIENKKLSSFSKAEKIAYLNSYLGFVFQEYNILKDLSLKENICLALDIQKHSRREKNKRFKEIIKAVELTGLEKRKVHQLSGGQKQRIAIARALIKHPKMIIADEPTGNLDSETSNNIFKLFKELSKERLIVIVSHDVESAEIYADQIIRMGMAESTSEVKNISKEEKTNKTQSIIEEYLDKIDVLKYKRDVALTGSYEDKDPKEIKNLVKKLNKISKHLNKIKVFNASDALNIKLRLRNNGKLPRLNKLSKRKNELIKKYTNKYDEVKNQILAYYNNLIKIETDNLNAFKKRIKDKNYEYLCVLKEHNLDTTSINDIKLNKAKIPLKTVLKLAIKNLWKKKFRYIVMLLVCAISLAFLSFTIELNGNKLRQNVFTMIENGYQYTEIKRYVPIQNTNTDDFYAQYNYGDLPANSYNIIKEGIPELTLHKYETVEIKYARTHIENKNYFYTGIINTLIEYDETNTYNLLCGRKPNLETQEIMISDYLIAALQYFDLVPIYDNYEDYLGMYIDLNWYDNYQVVGIIDSNYEKWVKFSRLNTIDETIKDNYSFINDFKMMNSVIINKEYFQEETKSVGDFTYLTEETINFVLPNAEKETEATGITIMSSDIASGINLIHFWGQGMPQGRMPSASDEIVLPLQEVEDLFGFTYSDYNYNSRRLLNTYWKENLYNQSITLNITSADGTKTYSKEYKIVGLTASTANYIISNEYLSEIKDLFLTGNENIMVELPSDPEFALTLFDKAYNLRDEEKNIPGYIINVWVYRSDIDSYEVDPFIDIISKGGLFVFTVFTIGIMWTIISIEIVDSRKEIGILRSIGLSGVKVSLIFIIQTLVVNILAYFLAVKLASEFIPLYNSTITDTTGSIILYMYTMTSRTPIYLLVFVLVMTIVCTVLPLIKIMSQKIIDVINEREK